MVLYVVCCSWFIEAQQHTRLVATQMLVSYIYILYIYIETLPFSANKDEAGMPTNGASQTDAQQKHTCHHFAIQITGHGGQKWTNLPNVTGFTKTEKGNEMCVDTEKIPLKWNWMTWWNVMIIFVACGVWDLEITCKRTCCAQHPLSWAKHVNRAPWSS